MNRWNCSSLEGRLGTLKLQEVSLAFLMLAGKLETSQLPPKLQELNPEEWNVLMFLLNQLEQEKANNPLH